LSGSRQRWNGEGKDIKVQRIANLLSLAIVSVIGACAPTVQPATPPAPLQQQSTADVAKLLVLAPQANGCTPGMPESFVARKVQVLASKPDATFENNFGGYDPYYLGPSPAGAPTSTESGLLKRAFELAPRWLQFHLCNQVNFVFVDPNPYRGNPEFGWAFWESSDPAQTQNGRNQSLARFIGISRAALEDPDLSLGQSETNVVQRLLRNPPAAPAVRVTAKITRGNTNVAADDGSAAWAVLAILAHEMGHMFWHDICDGDNNQNDQRRCFSHFHKFGWVDVGGHWTLRSFGDPIPGAKQLRDESGAALQQPRTVQAALQRLYAGNGPVRFADLFATRAPDEDIAETYKFLALTDAIDPDRSRVTSLIVQGDTWAGDVVANLVKPDLCAKVQFIRTSLLEPALPCSR